MRLALGIAIALAFQTLPLSAQHAGGHAHPPASPYAGQQARAVKALSLAQIAELEAGAGMGLALAAELNGYPGPRHVLEHSAALRLSAQQLAAVERLAGTMQADAIAIGKRIVAAEAELDHAFVSGSIDAARLDRMTAEIGTLMGALRAIHLRTHLVTKAALSPEQVAAYNSIRGYAKP